MFVGASFLLLGVAAAAEPGLALGLAGVRGSDGLHRIEPTTSLYIRRDMGPPGLFLEGEFLTAAGKELVPAGTMTMVLLRPAVLVGWEGGRQSLQVHGAVGPATTAMLGGLDGDQWGWRRGIRGRGGVALDRGDHRVSGATPGGAVRGRGGDLDFQLRLGWSL